MRRSLFKSARDLRPVTTITLGRDAGSFERGDVIGLLGGGRAIVKHATATTLTISHRWRLWRALYWLDDHPPIALLLCFVAGVIAGFAFLLVRDYLLR